MGQSGERRQREGRLSRVCDGLERVGGAPVGGSPEQLAPFIRAVLTKWDKIIHDEGIQAD